MRVWLVNHYATPPSQPGGTRHFTLARELAGRGHQAVVIAASYNHLTGQEMAPRAGGPSPVELIQGVPFLWLRTPAYQGNGPRRMRNMVSFARQVWAAGRSRSLERPDAILGSSPHPFAALAAERVARRLRVPFVLEVRDVWPQSLVDLGGIGERHLVTRGLERLERYLYQHADRIISLLPGAVEHIAGRGGKREHVVWIPNGVDLPLAPPPSQPVDDGVLTVMYAGAHGLANGLDVVLDAAALLQQKGLGDGVRFRLVGDGPEKRRLQRRAKAEDIDIVRFCDPVPKDDVYRVLQEGDLFLMMLTDSPVFRWGVSPNKLFDYLALARPVVFGVSSPHDPVAEAGAGVSIPPEDPPALAQAIAEMARTPVAERWAMGLRGRRYVEKNHAFAGLAERLERLLTEVVEEGYAGDPPAR